MGASCTRTRSRGIERGVPLENVSPKNVKAVNLYWRHGAVMLSPLEVGGHSDHRIALDGGWESYGCDWQNARPDSVA